VSRTGDYKYDIQVLAEEIAASENQDDENFDYFDLPQEKQFEYYERAHKRYWENR
jgi:hypothetical protein